MDLTVFYPVIALFIALERLLEVGLSKRNQRGMIADGYEKVEPKGRYNEMVVLHVFWLVCSLIEPMLYRTSPAGIVQFGAFAFLIGAQILRYWTLSTLGREWNTTVMSPRQGGVKVCQDGPYRFIRHPNYLAVIVEVASLPLIGGAYLTSILFSVLNGLVLRRRITLEEEFLSSRPGYEVMLKKPLLLPWGAARLR